MKKLNFSSYVFLFMSVKQQCYLFMLSSLKHSRSDTWWTRIKLLLHKLLTWCGCLPRQERYRRQDMWLRWANI